MDNKQPMLKLTSDQVESSEEHTTPRNYFVVNKSLHTSSVGLYFAILLNCVVIAFLIACAATDIWVRKPGVLSSSAHALLVTGITILASSISYFTTKQIKILWLRNMLNEAVGGVNASQDRRARILLSVGGFSDSKRELGLSFSLLVIGLITTSIVGGTTPTSKIVVLDGQGNILPHNLDSNCLRVTTTPQDPSFNWQLANGSYISINRTAAVVDHCPSQSAQTAALSYLTASFSGAVDVLGYALNGNTVSSNATGTPYEVVQGDFWEPFGTLFPENLTNINDLWVESATACFPNVVSNPVSCSAEGSVIVDQHNVTVTSGNCTVSNPVFAVDASNQSAAVFGACSDGRPLGRATILLGATNGYASQLAGSMGYEATRSNATGTPVFAVTCEVDIAPSVAFRQVTWIRQYANLAGSPGAVVTGSGPCLAYAAGSDQIIDVSQVLSPEALVMGASAMWQILDEGRYKDGWSSTLWARVWNDHDIYVTAEPTFTNSRNTLEDALGMFSAVTLGSWWGSISNIEGTPTDLIVNTQVRVQGVRLGPATWFSIIYILPEIIATMLLIWLLKSKNRAA